MVLASACTTTTNLEQLADLADKSKLSLTNLVLEDVPLIERDNRVPALLDQTLTLLPCAGTIKNMVNLLESANLHVHTHQSQTTWPAIDGDQPAFKLVAFYMLLTTQTTSLSS